MRILSLLLTITFLISPALAEERQVDRKKQMEVMKENFMKRRGIRQERLDNLKETREERRIRQQNKEYRNTTLKALEERKLRLQGVR